MKEVLVYKGQLSKADDSLIKYFSISKEFEDIESGIVNLSKGDNGEGEEKDFGKVEFIYIENNVPNSTISIRLYTKETTFLDIVVNGIGSFCAYSSFYKVTIKNTGTCDTQISYVKGV